MGKRKLSTFATFAAALLLLLGPKTAQAWDADGHMLITEIAARRLNPGVAEKIEPLLPLLDTRFNNDQPYNFVTAGAWMDDIRTLTSEYPWSRWHYIDLPCDGKVPKRPLDHENACWALENAIVVLHSPEAQKHSRAEAVAQILHLVGDIHQPLHTATHDDRGGNGYLLVPIVAPDPEARSIKPFNLHKFWDGAYRYAASKGAIVELWRLPSISRRPAGPNEERGPIAARASALLEKYPPEKLKELSNPPARPDPWRWICETHGTACKYGWPPGPPPPPNKVGKLSPDFVQTAHEIAERQIVLAGCRLADLLNSVMEGKIRK